MWKFWLLYIGIISKEGEREFQRKHNLFKRMIFHCKLSRVWEFGEGEEKYFFEQKLFSLTIFSFLASPDALEVIVVSYSLTHLLTDLLSVSTDLTDVTLVSDDTY